MHRSSCAFIILSCVLFTAGCTRFQLLNATVPSWDYCDRTNIAYGKLDRQKLDVYQPKNRSSSPDIVVFFYGGDWQQGRKDDYRFVAEGLASRGFIAVLPDYRLYPSVTFPAFVKDGAMAIRWVHDHARELGGSPDRIFLMGHSAGGHIAATLALDEQYLGEVGLTQKDIRGAIGLSGPYDFYPSPGDAAVFGGSPENIAAYPAMEPICHADEKAPPMLLVTGLQDVTVEPGNAWRLAEKMNAVGGSARVITYPQLAHVGVVLSFAFPFRWLAPTLDDVTDFIHSIDH